jgi:hypothetical protein
MMSSDFGTRDFGTKVGAYRPERVPLSQGQMLAPSSIVVTDQVYVAGTTGFQFEPNGDLDPFLIKIRKTDGRLLQVDR